MVRAVPFSAKRFTRGETKLDKRPYPLFPCGGGGLIRTSVSPYATSGMSFKTVVIEPIYRRNGDFRMLRGTN